MKRLAQLIGPAPSELSKEKLFERIRMERTRVSKALEAYSYRAPKKKKAKPKIKKDIKTLLSDLGLTEEEFLDAKKDIEREGKEEGE